MRHRGGDDHGLTVDSFDIDGPIRRPGSTRRRGLGVVQASGRLGVQWEAGDARRPGSVRAMPREVERAAERSGRTAAAVSALWQPRAGLRRRNDGDGHGDRLAHGPPNCCLRCRRVLCWPDSRRPASTAGGFASSARPRGCRQRRLLRGLRDGRALRDRQPRVPFRQADRLTGSSQTVSAALIDEESPERARCHPGADVACVLGLVVEVGVGVEGDAGAGVAEDG